MRELNKRIAHLDIPKRMSRLTISDEGFPVPWFVPWIDNKPEFRGMDGEKLSKAVRLKRCWLCSQPLGKFMTFVIGPMCAVNRNSSEPPCHHGCAEYAVRACPFLTQPRMRRNEKDMPEGDGVAGIMIKRNPGVTMLWTTTEYRVVRDGRGVLFRLGDPTEVLFFAEGRTARRDEIMLSIETGLPILREMALEDGPNAMVQLEKQIGEAMKYVPA